MARFGIIGDILSQPLEILNRKIWCHATTLQRRIIMKNTGTVLIVLALLLTSPIFRTIKKGFGKWIEC
jgi:hypothetical protein